MNVISIEENDMAHYSPLDNADQSKNDARLPDDKVVKTNVAPDRDYKPVVEHSTTDADHSRGQGSTDNDPTIEEHSSVPQAQPVKPNKLVDMPP